MNDAALLKATIAICDLHAERLIETKILVL